MTDKPSYHARPIPDFPGYVIERDGTVWRVTPSHLDVRYGPVPRRVTPVMMGRSGGEQPSVKLYQSGYARSRAIKTLVRAAFGSDKR